MILRTQENKANKKYEFNDFEFFYNFFQRLVNEKKFGDLKSFNNFNFKSKIIYNKFYNYFISHKETTLRQIRTELHCKTACPTKIEFWLERGFTEEESNNKIFKIQQNNGLKLSKKLKINPNVRVTSTQIEYYLNKGYSLEKSKELLKERQSTFTMEKLIKKYGSYEKAIEVFKKRQLKWRRSIDEKYSIEIQNFWRSKGSYCSKESLELFIPIYNYFKHNFNCYLKYDNKTEFFINDGKNFYCYDFVIKDLGLIFEYQGEHVHANKNWPQEKLDNWHHAFNGKNAQQYFEDYNKKIHAANEHGFKIIELWNSSSIEENSKIIYDEILQTLEVLHNKCHQS